MGNVENAIAAALKRDGKEPPLHPRLASLEQRDPNDDHHQDGGGAAVAGAAEPALSERQRNKIKKRKRRDADRELRRVSVLGKGVCISFSGFCLTNSRLLCRETVTMGLIGRIPSFREALSLIS